MQPEMSLVDFVRTCPSEEELDEFIEAAFANVQELLMGIPKSEIPEVGDMEKAMREADKHSWAMAQITAEYDRLEAQLEPLLAEGARRSKSSRSGWGNRHAKRFEPWRAL